MKSPESPRHKAQRKTAEPEPRGAGDATTATHAPRRRRDPVASRAAILEAAAEVFTERGYTRATIREIAKRAGVTHGLVMRHFGSKEQLLIAALPGPRGLADALPGDLQTLPERVADEFVSQIDSPYNALIALIRTGAAGDKAVRPLFTEFQHQTSAAYQDVLGAGVEPHLDLLRSLLIGVAFSRHVAATGTLATLSSEELTHRLEPAIRSLLAPVLPEG